jgi:ribosomal protein L7/L12
MDLTTLLILGAVALAVAGAVLFALNRSWGSSLDRSRMPIQGVADPRVANISDHTLREVQALVARGNKIEAIKRLRDLTGLGLKEAKDYVESLPPIMSSGDDFPPDAQPAPRPLSETDLDELRALVAQGNKIVAIKRCRELTGLGLKEAKDFVEALPASGPVYVASAPTRATAQALVSQADLNEVRALLARGNKIEAIKRYRELTGLGLKEAKDFVDTL